jgi:hypothetical protein
MTATRGERLTLGFSFAKPRPWKGFQCWPRQGEDAALHELIIRASPRQRTLLGFPAPGDPYWTKQTIEAITRRYIGFDPTPYQNVPAIAGAEPT